MRMKVLALAAASTAALTASATRALADGRLLVLDSSREVFEVNLATGERTLLGSITPSSVNTVGALAYDCENQILYLSSTTNDALYRVDPVTLQATLIGSYGNPAVVMHGLEWHSGLGKLFGLSSHTGRPLYEINTTTGFATFIANTPFTGFVGIGYDSDDDVMYAADGGTDSLYRLNVATGAATLVGPLVNATSAQGLAYNKDNHTMYLCDNTGGGSPGFRRVCTVNLQTGEATVLGPLTLDNFLGIAYLPEVCGGSHDPCNLADVAEIGGSAESPGIPDHQLTIDDLIVFVNLFSDQTGCPGIGPCNRADVTGIGGPPSAPDGELTVDDLIAFVNAFSDGC